ncbi:hypothetical protein LCGC14_1787000, partial [marine sediment metagenome]
MPSHRTEIEVLQDLDEVVSKQRIDKSTLNLSSFILFYFKHLTPNATPPFHKEILTLLQDSIIPSVGLTTPHENTKVHTKVHDLELKGTNSHGEGENHIRIDTERLNTTKEEGRDDPLVPPVYDIRPPTQFPPTKTETLDSNKMLLSGEKEKLNRLLFIAPRGFSKSTLCSRFFPMWLAVM